jgi:DMSO/TMAO reductase YedYZ molybdopterin-dependent catalytic subunit
MDESCEVILAYQQNGKPLEPDHGFPIRILIPGYIGGRMVKWLTKIEVTEKESGNYYHFHDNRMLPSHVDAELAKAEGVFLIHVFSHCFSLLVSRFQSQQTSAGHRPPRVWYP